MHRLDFTELRQVAHAGVGEVLLWDSEFFLRERWWRRWRKPKALHMYIAKLDGQAVWLKPAWLPWDKAQARTREFSFYDIALGTYTEHSPDPRYYLTRVPCRTHCPTCP